MTREPIFQSQATLETEWRRRSVLPPPRTSPPPSSAQKVHKVEEEEISVADDETTTSSAPTPAPAPVAPTPTRAPTVTPFTFHTPAPAASMSNLNSAYGKPVAIRPRSQLSPDMDIDILSDDGQGTNGAPAVIQRDHESEEIVKQLEKGLPRWTGFGDDGWAEDVSQERMLEILLAIKSYKDVIGNRLAVALEDIPEDTSTPYLSFTVSLPFTSSNMKSRVRSKHYQNSKEFDLEMSRFFEKARRCNKPGTEPYGRALLLQRFYQALTSSNPPPGPPYHTTTNFAAVRAGPGCVKPVHGGDIAEGVSGVTTHRVLTKDRTFVDQVHYKGWTVKLADWVHLSNPDDPSRPITFHPPSRLFWEGEVFKTSHFADHPAEDIIEKIACQFTARHIRGRPRPPFWYLGFPLYICDSRYNDRDRVFVKIKNWNSCVPEEVRKSTEFMPIYPFERTVLPNRYPSPFVGRGVKGPGGLVAADPVEQQQVVEAVAEPSTNGRSMRPRRNGTTVSDPTSNGARAHTSNGAQGINAAAATSQYHYQPSNLSQQLQVQNPRSSQTDRSVVAAAGGLHALGHGAHIDKLPAETAKHFERDPETNEVLWFPAPPVDMARPAKPKYSLAYLEFLATKRKRVAGEIARPEDTIDVDSSQAAKRPRLGDGVSPYLTVTETLRLLLRGGGLAAQ
ncbi:hypothetical protein H0H81_009857 [Sphagnurus paluster]|uniref:Bromo domain-containing protein n=1 Tax=Sphagnurus paluster TaxID=117069 RepID=A0A9P7KG60_9AGAR|nr:hypothetical protein H0H81_009857 [Sphagnurus paluster]